MAPPPPPPPPPSNFKPPRSKPSSSLQPRPHWKGKTGSRKQIRKRNANPVPNPNISRRKQHTGDVGWLQDHSYQPPRLQDLQFQNRLKSFRHFDDRCNAAAVYNSGRPLLVDTSVASASGFSMPAPRSYVADAHVVAGLPFKFPGQGPGFGGSLAYPDKRKATLPDFLVTNTQLLVPGSVPYTRKLDASLLPGVSLPPISAGNALNFGMALYDYTGKGNAFTSSPALVVPKASKSSVPFKRFKGSHRTRKAIIAARKQGGAPAAPRNTTSFLMRAKKAGGITSFVSPSPATSAVIPTPVMSPFETQTGLADEASHEWGVNDYGSMSGLIRLRSLDFGLLDYGDHVDSGSEVEQGAESVQQLEERLDQDVSRFVMTYPSNRGQDMGQNLLETSMDDQDCHIAHLEEENLDLRGQLFSMQLEVQELQRRVRALEGVTSGDEAEVECSAEVLPERSGANLSFV